MHHVTPDLGAYLTATAPGKSQDGLGTVAASGYGVRSRNGRQRPTSSIGEHAPFVTMRRALSERHLLGAALGGDSSRLACLAHRRHGRGFDGRRAGDLHQAYWSRARARRAGRRIVVRHRLARRQIESLAALLVYLATMADYRVQLVQGERGVALCLARTQEQSQVVLEYVVGVSDDAPIPAKMVIRRAADSLTLFNRGATIVIAVRAASFRTARGLACVAAVPDEIAFGKPKTVRPIRMFEILRAGRRC
jgi:hypothetical protein